LSTAANAASAPYALFRLPASPTPASIAGRNEVIVLSADSEGLDPWLEVGVETPVRLCPGAVE
jgi:hypothetical protein